MKKYIIAVRTKGSRSKFIHKTTWNTLKEAKEFLKTCNHVDNEWKIIEK